MNMSQGNDIAVEAIAPAGGGLYQSVKRGLDVLLSIVLLITLSPLMLLVTVLIALTSRGGVVFSQERAGQDGQPFRMLKFRTMVKNAENDREFLSHLNQADGPVFKIRSDPRMTWLGRWLRRSSIDELPQLFNVIAGQMSIVGPRPLWVKEANDVQGAAKNRVRVKPGLTCLWQISGRSELPYDQWVALDLFYIRKRSLILDILIMLRTLPAILSARGAY